MNPRRIWALALAAQAAHAFQDTSPFFLFSTTKLVTSAPSDAGPFSPDAPPQLVTAASLSAQLSLALDGCPSDTYIIMNQPGVRGLDFATPKSSPNLRAYLNGTRGVKEAWVVSEVVGTLDSRGLEKWVEEKCRADVLRIDAATGTIPTDSFGPRINYVQFPALPTDPHLRADKLAEQDAFLHAVISEVGGEKYTVIYTTTPPSLPAASSTADLPYEYEMDESLSQGLLHTDLKRSLAPQLKNGTDLPLFDKYEFLSPGLFMGLVTFLILGSILYVGITAVASLEVSYFAFSKEMGPSQQRKQQ